MQKNYIQFKKIIFITILSILSFNLSAQQINSVSIGANPTDCAPITVATSGILNSLSYVVDSTNYYIVNNTLYYNIHFNNPGIIVPALGTFTHPDQLNNVPAGNYTVIVSTFLGGTGATAQSTFNSSMNVISCCPISPAITVSNNASNMQLCSGDSVILGSSNTTGATSYSWLTNGNVVSSDTTITLTFATAGQYTYTLEASDGSCSQQTSVTFTVSDIPVIDLGSDTSICDNVPLILNAQFAAPSVTYSWLGTANTSPTNTVSAAGVYTVQLTNGICSYSDSITILSVLPSPSVTLANDSILCHGQSITLDATQTGLSYLWSDGSTGSTLMIDSSAVYTVTVTNSDGCSATDAMTLSVRSELIINLGDTATVTSTTLNAGVFASYLWSTGATTQTLFVDAGGIYSVTVTDVFGCTATDQITITITNTDNLLIEDVKIYPNPAFDVLNIEMETSFARVEVYNQLGELVLLENMNNQQLTVKSLTSGVYYLRLKDENDELIGVARFLKE